MKKFLLSLIALVMSVFSANAAWEQTTSIAVGDVVVLAVDNGSVTKELSAVTTTGTTIGQVVDYTTTPEGVYPLTVVKGTAEGSFGFKNADGAYLAWSSGNSLKTTETLDESASWTVTFTEAGTADIYNVGTPVRKLQYNAGSPRFACYGNSGQTAPIFFKEAAAGSVLKPTITPGSKTVFEAQEVAITAEDGADIYYTLNGGEEQKYEAPFTVTETTTIEAYAQKGEEKSETAKVVITFGPVFNTFAAANEAATGDRIVSRVNFTDALVIYVNGSNAYIKDASGALMIYGTNDLVAGDKIKGYVQGQLYTYNGLPEIASPVFEVETVSSGNAVTPVEVSAADLAANPLKYVSQYVKVKPAKFGEDAEVASKVNLNFTVGDVALVLRNNFIVEFGVEAGTSYEVAGLVTIYNGTVQLYPTKEEDIAEMEDSEAAYYDAIDAIEAGAVYRIKTNVGGTMYYLKSDGTLTADEASAGVYKFSKVPGAAYEYGFNLLESYFTNPPQGGNPVLNNGRIAVDPNSKRKDWEAQVFFLKDGKYAVRATNAAGGDSGWSLNAKTFWTVNEGPVAEYSFDMNYIWELEFVYDAEAAKQHEEAAATIQTWVTTIQAAKGLVQDASKYTSNAVQQGEGSIAALLDGTYETYFHSCWSNGPAEDHYLQAELPEATQKFQFYYKKRHNNNNNRPTSIVISASNDGATFTDVTTINSGLPTDASVLDYVSDVIDLGSAYKYVRFTITGTNNGATNNGHLFFTFSEFYMLPNVPEAAEALAIVKEGTPTYSIDVDKVMAVDAALKAAFKTVNVTYALYEADGTLVSEKIVVQEAESDVNVPSDMVGLPYYDYATEGTVGDEDCTIKVVRTFKEGVVHSLSDLSNNKAYTIRCDRGALLTKDDHVASTAHGSLNGAEAGLFAIINHEDHYYLYSVADKKFMTFDPTASPEGARGPLADAPTHGTEDAIVLEAKTDPYFFAYFTAGGTNYGFNTNGNDPYGYVINTWMNADPGNLYYMIEAADFDPTEALVALGVQPKLEYTKYIVQNVGSGLYWGAGNDWGTRASLIANPEFVKFDPTDMPEGQYKLESQVNNGGTQYYFNGDYMDNGSPAPLAITMLTNGNFTIANATDGGFYGYDGNSTVLGKGLTNADDPNAQWTIVTLEEAKAALANATEEAPMNAGLLFDDLNFGRNNRYSNKWIVSEDCTNKNLSGGNNTNNNAESFHSVFTVSQSVEAPNGVYEITAQGFYRQDGSDNENLPVFFANEETQTFPLKTGSENSMSDASASFTNGLYTIDPIYVQVTDGTLNIGAKLEGNTELWCIWDNFQVKYYGADADINNVKFAALIAEVEELRAKAEELKANEYVTEIAAGVLENALTETAEVEKTEEALKAAIETLKAAIETGDICVEIAPKLAAAKTLLASTNVYTAEAKAAYEAYIAEAEGKYTDGTLTRAEASAFENPLVVTGWHHDASKVADDLLLSAWTINEVQAKDFTTSLYINTWSVEGESDGSNFKVPFYEYWTGDDNSLGKATLTATMTDIEPGYYEVSVWARVRAKNGYTAPAYGITLDVNGEGAEDVAAGKQVGSTQFYLAEFKAYGNVAEDGILKINLNVAEDNNISWLSFKNVNYTTSDDPSPDAAYERALAAIEDGQNYRIFTEVDGQKYYVTEAGKLSSATADGGIFALKKVTGGAFKEYGWKIDSGSKRFTNPPLSNNVANLTPGVFATTTNDRNDWEAQVLFLTNGKYAIRSCNTAHGTSSWADAGRTFWTWSVNEAVTPEYTYDQVYLWQFEGPLTTVNVTYALYDAEGTEAISTATKKQEANSEVIIPADMASNFAYDYTTEGTVGEEDCTIKVVRTFKEGVVHSLDDLSNEKAYTIRCDRGALLTKDGYVASTAHGSLNGAEAGQFAIINYEDHYYLYSIADKKFMTFDVTASPEGARGPLADEPTHGTDDAIILEAKTDPYFLAYFTVDGTNYGFNTNGNDPYGYVINTWMTADPGNLYYMVEAADFDPTEALAALEEYFHPGGDGINSIDANLENAVIYDLTGRRVSEAMKGGIYIVNGKKVFLK